MTTEEALQFLQQHQPMPPTTELPDSLIRKFDEVRKYFAVNRDERCIPLLLNSFGEGDGYGVYQLVEDTILGFPKEIVVSALKSALSNPQGSVRYWNAEIAANYPMPELAPSLIDLLHTGNIDERMAAVIALERISSPEVRRGLEAALDEDIEDEVKELIRSVLNTQND